MPRDKVEVLPVEPDTNAPASRFRTEIEPGNGARMYEYVRFVSACCSATSI